jgi:hypothetical protein
MNAEATAMYGAKKKIQRSAFSGMKSSFVSSFSPVGDRLQQSPWSNSHRTKPRLHERGDLSFEVSRVSDPERDECHDETDLDQRPNEESDRFLAEGFQQEIVKYVYRAQKKHASSVVLIKFSRKGAKVNSRKGTKVIKKSPLRSSLRLCVKLISAINLS